jgi:outer membrane protein
MSEVKRCLFRVRRRAGASVLAAGALVLTGCIHHPPSLYGMPSASPALQVPWTPPPQAKSPVPEAAAPSAAVPEEFLQRAQGLTLADLVDMALRNSPQTAEAWAQARSAAAAFGSKRGEYYPTVDIGGSVGRTQGSFANGAISYAQRSYGPTAGLQWLLFDFGGREAAVEETRQALYAADWTHNAVIQNVILQVQQTYYQYVTAKALLEAQRASYKEAQTSFEAAQERHKAGVATIADVLQSKTAVSQAKLALESLEGQIQTTKGALATAVGLPANTPYDVSFPRESIRIAPLTEAVDKFLKDAQAQRPDLAAMRAEAAKAEAHLKSVKAEGYPSLTAQGTAGRVFYDHSNIFGNTYSAQILLKFPLFTGFSHSYDVAQAKADRDAAVARLQGTEKIVALQVWSSYFVLKTAEQRVATSEDLLKSASESYDVASGRYKEGVGAILDLLSAQAALESARAQRIQAYSDWYMALAQLAHDAGALSPASGQLETPTPVTVEEERKP